MRTIQKSGYDDMYSVGDVESRIYCFSDKILFVVTVERRSDINFLFSFDDLSELKEYSGPSPTSIEGDKVTATRIYFGDDGIADVDSLTRRKAYLNDYKRAISFMKRHVKEKKEFAADITSSII